MDIKTTEKALLFSLVGLLSLFICFGCKSGAAKANATNSAITAKPQQIIVKEESTTDNETVVKITTTIQSIDNIDKYGNTTFELTSTNLFTAGFTYGDIVNIKLAKQNLTLPVVPHYHYVQTGEMALIAPRESSRPIKAAVFYGSFAKEAKIAELDDLTATWVQTPQITFPIDVQITMAQQGGYLSSLQVAELHRSTNRNDYATLSDKQYANFRAITSPLIATGAIYRSSSPIDPILGRSEIADNLAQQIGIRTIWNMANTKEAAQKLPGYDHSHYATCNVIYTVLGVDFTSELFKESTAKAIRYLIEHNPPYLLHCTEGKDRTGFVAALLQALTGADAKTIANDYAESFRHYYEITKDSTRDKAISENILTSLKNVLQISDLTNLEKAATDYLLSTGLTEEELKLLKQKLSSLK